MSERDFSSVRRIVIKVGTSLLRSRENTIDSACLKTIAAQIAGVRKEGRQVVLVSSGAVGFGMLRLGLARRPADITALQAAAAIGQPELMQAWSESFAAHRIHVAQLLLTNDGLQTRSQFLNAKNALLRTLDLGVVPVVNENDTVAVEELKFGDNDTLSALVAAMIHADLLINLTDVDGFKDSDGAVLNTIPHIRREWLKPSSESKEFTVGGMAAKLKAAQIALRAGIPVMIANGGAREILPSILQGRLVGSLLTPGGDALKGKKIWLRFFPSPAGRIVVDRGAAAAVSKNGKSLLPSGILRAAGKFPRKSCVSVVTEEGHEIARGITYYSADEITAIIGCPSSAIRDRLGLSADDPAAPEVIHRDNLAVTT